MRLLLPFVIIAMAALLAYGCSVTVSGKGILYILQSISIYGKHMINQISPVLNFVLQWQLTANGAVGHLGVHGMITMVPATAIAPDMSDGINQTEADHAAVAENR